MPTDPPSQKPKPGAEDLTRVADLSGGQQPTLVSDLVGGSQPTVVADLSGRRDPTTGVTGPAVRAPTTALTAAPGSDIQDAIPTQMSDPARAKGSTDVTSLHVSGGRPPSADGTHLGEVWGDFQFDRLLGRGGMGAVYLGKQISLDRQVAIKVLPSQFSGNEQFRERFQLEAKAVAKMSSPHVVQVYAAGSHHGHHYFAMEYVEGEDLSRKLRVGFKPSYRQSLELVIQAAKGLCAAGEHGIVHRDIKPGNMMIDRKGALKLMDFGLVRLASAGHSLTMAGTVMGTVSYFSPEQGRGEACDQRTDLYALGVVFYELLTGRLPFTGENATSVIYQHIHSAPRQPRELDPNIPEHYQAVVLKCLQKLADDRYASAQELLADLERLAADKPPSIALERPDLLVSGATILGSGTFAPPRGAGAPRSRTGLVAGLGVAALALAGAAGWYALHAQPPPPPVPAPAPPRPVPPTVAAPAPTSDPELKQMLAGLAKRQDQEAARQQVLAKADGLLADGDYAKAEALLAAVAAQAPGDAQLEAALRRVRAAREQAGRLTAAVDAQLEQGDAALQRGDLVAARLAYTAARQIDPRDQRPAAKLAEVEKRGAAAPPPLPPADPGKAGTTALAAAKAALQRGDLPEARRVVNVNRGLNAGDPQWAALAKELDAAEGRSLLHEAQGAFSRGNFELAGKSAAQAQGLIPDDPELKQLLSDIEKVEGERKQRDRTMQEADNLLTEGKPGKAEELLAALAGKLPDDAQVANALRRARAEREKADALQKAVSEQLAQAEAALARADLDAAQLAYTAVRQLDPKNEKASAGLDAVRARKDAVEAARVKVEAAIKAKDIAAVEAAMAGLRTLAPSSPQVVLAEGQLAGLKAEQAEAKRKADELERARQEQARKVAALLDDPAQGLPALEEAVAGFRSAAGAERPELSALEGRLDDRRARAAAEVQIAALDAALKGRDAAAIARLVGDPAWADALGRLAAVPGSVAVHAITACARSGDKAELSATLRTSTPDSPEETLAVRYDLARGESGWRIVAAHLKQP